MGRKHDELSVSNSTTQVLNQIAAGAGGWAGSPHPVSRAGMAERVRCLGLSEPHSGCCKTPTALRDFTPSRNNLPVARTLLQVDENYRFNESNTSFIRVRRTLLNSCRSDLVVHPFL